MECIAGHCSCDTSAVLAKYNTEQVGSHTKWGTQTVDAYTFFHTRAVA